MQNKEGSIFTKIATCFGIGNFTTFPGTVASAAVFLLFPLIVFLDLPLASILIASVLLFALGTYSCHKYEMLYSVRDPGNVVIDEFVAQTILILFTNYIFRGYSNTMILVLCILSFLLFRFFDIVKPWPISVVQRSMRGGFGVMFDDLLAAIASLIVLLLILYVSC
ncbi:phosphatidylglycerophosphatase A family protein [Neorickettsia helminthoeca str. Oregon]|uniref:Phosphatidylglycerophosphatase A n=1 Tax=Neorickettsia helminthoeca str. Oregon TaxID=1286528 RepID=X5HJH5_9RICK|nr:phosphatidylglycerophosphatase A [Neorickettsia helminthoeca]AHX11234.1 phosphatidylglycerophosphatase A family protein [Neorickettsia helminthoeca str. Oregon]